MVRAAGGYAVGKGNAIERRSQQIRDPPVEKALDGRGAVGLRGNWLCNTVTERRRWWRSESWRLRPSQESERRRWQCTGCRVEWAGSAAALLSRSAFIAGRASRLVRFVWLLDASSRFR